MVIASVVNLTFNCHSRPCRPTSSRTATIGSPYIGSESLNAHYTPHERWLSKQASIDAARVTEKGRKYLQQAVQDVAEAHARIARALDVEPTDSSTG